MSHVKNSCVRTNPWSNHWVFNICVLMVALLIFSKWFSPNSETASVKVAIPHRSRNSKKCNILHFVILSSSRFLCTQCITIYLIIAPITVNKVECLSYRKADTICVFFASYNASVLLLEMNIVDTNPYCNGLHHIGFNQDQGMLDNRKRDHSHSALLLSHHKHIPKAPIYKKKTVQCKQKVRFAYRTHAKSLFSRDTKWSHRLHVCFSLFLYVILIVLCCTCFRLIFSTRNYARFILCFILWKWSVIYWERVACST